MLLQYALPPEVSMADSDGKYGFAALPRTKTAETALVHQILWLFPPENHQIVSHKLQI